MSEICDAGKIVIDMDAIHADLNGQLDDTTAKGCTDTNPEAFTDTSQLESPQFDPYNKYTLSTPKSPSTFATVVMNGVALVASGQQLHTRFIAQGYTQRPGLDYDQTISPVIHLQTVHILFALAHRYRLHIVKSVRQQLSSVFSIMDQGNVAHIIRMNVKYDHKAQMLLIDQSGYIEGTLEKFGMSDAWAVHSPATEATNAMGPWQGDMTSAEEIRHYASLVGSLLWIAQGTHPDIAFAVGQCA
ncbi:uncharacterized protein UDID_17071 [Ustilago sp. UG-2017a]|nr:uncharacterized protein UDID_17071 [Ustilago sp. UG-2017a]